MQGRLCVMTCTFCTARIPLPRRRDARYCSSACRQAAYRARRDPIPAQMRERARWVRHDARKRPLTATGRPASVTDSSTWCTYAEARASTAGTGVGIVLGDGLGCIDLDDAIRPDGTVKPWAQEVLDEYGPDSILTEVSMSRRGLHLFLHMDEAPGRRIREGDVKIEVYSRARFIAVTGQAYNMRHSGTALAC